MKNMLNLFKKIFKSIYHSSTSYNLYITTISYYDKMTKYSLEKKRFKEGAGYRLNLEDPKSFNEKIVWKKINDRNPLLPIVADKYKVREYIKDVLGEEEASKILIPLLYVTDRPESISFEKLPSDFVVKINHASGQNIIIRNGNYNKKEIIKKCKRWLKRSYGLEKHEWAYQNIKRKVIIEKLILDEKGNLPKDYKFHIFHGECKLIQVNYGLFYKKDERYISLYTPKWEKINVYWEFPIGEKIEKPNNLKEMIDLARKLSGRFDYARIDLYSIKDKIYFGEITNYPTSGRAKSKPQSFDFELGENWKIKPRYWIDKK